VANSTADTPNVSEAELANMTIDQLRDHARMLGIDGADELHKPELLAEVKDRHYAQAHGGRHRPGTNSAGAGTAAATKAASTGSSGNQTADTPDVSEAELANMTIDQLREHARMLGIDGVAELHKPELLAEVKDRHYAQAHGGQHRPDRS
jgi:hypothetical protein